MHCILELNQSECLKPYIESNLQNRIEAENGEKMEKPLQIIEEGCIPENNGKREK